MKNFRSILSAFTLALIATSSIAFAQGKQAETPMLKPDLLLGDVKNVSLFIDNVDIRGNEVDAFLDVKQTLAKAAEAAEKAGKKADDKITVEMKIETARNFLLLMSRAPLKGGEAEKFKAIITAVTDAADKAQK
ncbi:MAG: hypothetical protein FGM24_05885 [Candidatus Kapabacteria bacterium]|nr:hypothetical protein [Candidatus Kapabacteria bacterium]